MANIAKASLPPAGQRLVELMQRLHFGQIVGLHVRAGQPVLNPLPRLVRDRKLGSEPAPRNVWEATSWPTDFPYHVEHKHPDRLMVYRDAPWWIKIHGHSGLRFLDYVNGGRKPHGDEFVEAVRKLCDLAGVPFPEKEQTEEQREQARKLEARRAVLDDVAAYCEQYLWDGSSAEALDYLRHKRGLSHEQIHDLHVGLYPPRNTIRQRLKERGHDAEAIKDAAADWSKMEGYIVLPWRDDRGRMLTLYGRWPGDPPKGNPKTIALPGKDTKASPYCLDRALRAGHRELIVVEGLFDAAYLQVRGETRAVASVAAQFGGEQIKTLVRRRIEKVFVVGDPDGGGDRGTADNVKQLLRNGIAAYVPPRLPDGMDPDEYVLSRGVEAWRQNISWSIHGFRHIARTIIASHGQREPGDDQWGDDLIQEARSVAAEWGAEYQDLLRRNFWNEIAKVTGSVVEDLCPRQQKVFNKGPSETNARAPRSIEPYQPFPVEALPPIVQGCVRASAAALGCDVAYVALPSLAALAGAIGNSRVIRLKRGWTEPAITSPYMLSPALTTEPLSASRACAQVSRSPSGSPPRPPGSTGS